MVMSIFLVTVGERPHGHDPNRQVQPLKLAIAVIGTDHVTSLGHPFVHRAS